MTNFIDIMSKMVLKVNFKKVAGFLYKFACCHTVNKFPYIFNVTIITALFVVLKSFLSIF